MIYYIYILHTRMHTHAHVCYGWSLTTCMWYNITATILSEVVEGLRVYMRRGAPLTPSLQYWTTYTVTTQWNHLPTGNNSSDDYQSRSVWKKKCIAFTLKISTKTDIAVATPPPLSMSPWNAFWCQGMHLYNQQVNLKAQHLRVLITGHMYVTGHTSAHLVKINQISNVPWWYSSIKVKELWVANYLISQLVIFSHILQKHHFWPVHSKTSSMIRQLRPCVLKGAVCLWKIKYQDFG